MQSGAAGVQDKCPDHWQTLSGRGRQESDPEKEQPWTTIQTPLLLYEPM